MKALSQKVREILDHGWKKEKCIMYINGQWTHAKSDAVFDVFNPATHEKIGEVPDGGRDDAARAIDAAGRAFKTWSRLTAYQRSKYLYDAHLLMTERREQLARVMTEEQGKPLKAARNEVQYGADFLLWYAEEAKRIYGRRSAGYGQRHPLRSGLLCIHPRHLPGHTCL